MLIIHCCPRRSVQSGRSGGSGWPTRWRRRWDDLPGERALARDHHELPVAASADLEELVVCFLKNAQHIGHPLAAASQLGWAPADRDPFADVGGCDPDFEQVAHAGHLLPMADPGGERAGARRAAQRLAGGSGPVAAKLKVDLAAASPSALFWARAGSHGRCYCAAAPCGRRPNWARMAIVS